MSQITRPAELNYLYRFEAGSAIHRFTDIPALQSFDGEDYLFNYPIRHSRPKYSSEAQDAEIDIEIHDTSPITDLFVDGPPPYQVKVRVYEYDRDADTVTAYYRGDVVRSNFLLDRSVLSLHCKTVWHYFERESLSDSLSALSRYSIYDPRAGVDAESLRETITVTALNDERDILTVTGITQSEDWYRGGRIKAQDNDERTIIDHTIEGSDEKLYLSSAFPRFTLATGFTADIYPGDDLTYETWANKFASQTNNGEKHGGWTHTPNVDPAKRGVL